jgi:hypothetical protein
MGATAIGFLNRRALIVTNQRILLLQLGMRNKPRELAEQIRYSAIERLSGTLFGNTRIRFTTGARITLTNVPRADRKFLVKLIELTGSRIDREKYGLENLCCYSTNPFLVIPRPAYVRKTWIPCQKS